MSGAQKWPGGGKPADAELAGSVRLFTHEMELINELRREDWSVAVTFTRKYLDALHRFRAPRCPAAYRAHQRAA